MLKLPASAQYQIKRAEISTTPLSLLNVYNGPNVALGLAYCYTDRHAIAAAFALQQPGMEFYYRDGWKGINGFFSRLEWRRYFSNTRGKRALDRGYYSIELIGGQQRYTRTDELTQTAAGVPKEKITYYNVRTHGSLMLNLGNEWIYSSNFQLAFNFGFGVRANNVENDLTEDEAYQREMGDWTVPTNYIQKKGFSVLPRFQISVRIAYRVGKLIDLPY